MDISKQLTKSMVKQFYDQFGIKQYNSFSGGFRYLQSQKEEKKQQKIDKKEITRQNLLKQFGLSNAKVRTYKLDNDYVPDTKSELVDKLMQKLEHQRKKMRYYREKYYGEEVEKFEGKYRE